MAKWQVTHWFGWRKLNMGKYRFYDLYKWICGRCYNKAHSSYKNYWGRWIKCLRNTFEEFRDDMYDSYLEHIEEYWREQTSLERINNDWDYCKENCRWATRKEQALNTRQVKIAIVDWIKYTSVDLAEMCWIAINTWNYRINKFNEWKLTKEQLLKIWYIKWTKWARRKRE